MAPKWPGRPRIFDVSHPSQARPGPNSRPVIVGHRPRTTDPMVRQRPPAPRPAKPPPPPSPKLEYEAAPVPPVTLEQPSNPVTVPPKAVVPEPPVPKMAKPADISPVPPTEKPPAKDETADVGPHDHEHFEMHWWSWAILALIGVLIAVYLAIDSGLIKSNINLPFHLFKQDTANDQTAASGTVPLTNTTTTPTNTPTIPANWTTYQNKTIGYKFSYPKSWGEPVATNKAFEVYKFSKEENILLDVGTKDFCPQVDAPQTKTSQGWYKKSNDYYLTWCKNNVAWDGKDYPAGTKSKTIIPINSTTIMTYQAGSGPGTPVEAEIIFNLAANDTYSGLSIYRSWKSIDKFADNKIVAELKEVAATVTEF